MPDPQVSTCRTAVALAILTSVQAEDVTRSRCKAWSDRVLRGGCDHLVASVLEKKRTRRLGKVPSVNLAYAAIWEWLND